MPFSKNKYSLLIGCVIVLASCGIHKQYHRPDLQLPEQFHGAHNTDDTTSVANIGWRSFFADPQLQVLIEKGLQYNYDLQIALKHIDAANQQLKQAKQLLLPDADFLANYQLTRPSDNSLNGITAQSFLHSTYIENYNAQISISWEADIWGKLGLQKQAAVAQYMQTYEVGQAVQTRLISDIAQGYYNLEMLDKQLTVAKSNLALADSIVLMTRLQRDAGNVTTLALEQAEAQRQVTATLIPAINRSISLQENALNILTGAMPGEVIARTELDDQYIKADLHAGIPVQMVNRRPDVRAAELGLVAANKKVGIAKTQMYPTLNITAAGGINSFKASNWFSIPASLFGMAAGSLAQPLLQHRTLKTQYKVAQTQRDESVLAFRQSVLKAVGEVSDALISIDRVKEQKELLASRVKTLHTAVSDAQMLFNSGLASYLEVITAQSNALQAELDLASMQKQQMYAAIDLYRATGGGRN